MSFRNTLPDIIFILFLLVASFFYGYFTTLNNPPEGTHVWRQADGASMAYNYYVDGNPLLEPQMSNQQGNLGKAAGEFPLMYYFVWLSYFWLRLFSLPYHLVANDLYWVVFSI